MKMLFSGALLLMLGLTMKTVKPETISTAADKLPGPVMSLDQASQTLNMELQSISRSREIDSNNDDQSSQAEVQTRSVGNSSELTNNETEHQRVVNQYGIPLPNISNVEVSQNDKNKRVAELGSWNDIYDRLIKQIFTTPPPVEAKPKDIKSRITYLSNLFESVKAKKSSKIDMDLRYGSKIKKNDQPIFYHNNSYNYEIGNDGALKLPQLQGISEKNRWDSSFLRNVRPEKEENKEVPMLRSRLAASEDYEEPKFALLDEDFPNEGEELALKKEYREKVKDIVISYI